MIHAHLEDIYDTNAIESLNARIRSRPRAAASPWPQSKSLSNVVLSVLPILHAMWCSFAVADRARRVEFAHLVAQAQNDDPAR